MLKVENLIKTYNKRKVISDVSFSFNKGEILVIMGLSGCGKSTLLRHLIGSEKPDSGKIYINDQEITRMNVEELLDVKKKIGMLFQSGALFNSMTVGENIAFPLKELTSLDDHIINIVVKIKLELVGLTGFEHYKPAEISGGMKKRVGLARAMALDPDLIFCDEPGAGLDPVTAAVIDQLILDLAKKMGVSIIVVTHEMKSAFRIADRMIMLHEGEIIFEGTADEVRNSDNEIVKQFIEGNADGAIPMKMKSDNYIANLEKY